MAKKIKFKNIDSNVAETIANAFSELTSLAEECREIVDNASEGLSQTNRIQTLETTASALEGLDEPEVPGWIAPTKVTYAQWENSRKGRGLSRADRAGQAVAMLDAAIDVLEGEKEDADSDKVDELTALIDECETAKGEAEGAEFPGMYG